MLNNNAYVLSHNGIGDNITMIGAINYLLSHYNNVYLLCKDKYYDNIRMIYDESITIIPFDYKNEKQACINILQPKYLDTDTDIYICGCHKNYLKNKINNPKCNVDSDISLKWSHIQQFYNDMNLNLDIYYKYFDIKNSSTSLKLYNDIKHLNIIFCHTQASTNKININNFINPYLQNDEFIVICSNENLYSNEHKYHMLVNCYVDLMICHYIDIIKQAYKIFIIDSCFACIVYPLELSKNLNANEIIYFER